MKDNLRRVLYLFDIEGMAKYGTFLQTDVKYNVKIFTDMALDG